MTSKAVAEQPSFDHFHLAVHFTVPFIDSEEGPVMTATTARHVNRHLVATGPILAIASPDMPYPVPGLSLMAYLRAVLASSAVLLTERPELVVYGTSGKNIKENILPAPIPSADFLL